MFLADALTFRLNRDAASFCALSANFSCDIVDGRTRKRKACRTVRACPGSVALASNSTRKCVGNMDILVAR